MKYNIESSLKRFLKRKVKITMGFVVAFMIMGVGAFGADFIGEAMIEQQNTALCQIVLVEKTNKFSSNSSDFRWSYFVANKLLLIKILALK